MTDPDIAVDEAVTGYIRVLRRAPGNNEQLIVQFHRLQAGPRFPLEGIEELGRTNLGPLVRLEGWSTLRASGVQG